MKRAIDEHAIKLVIDEVYTFEDLHKDFGDLECGPFPPAGLRTAQWLLQAVGAAQVRLTADP